MTDHSNPPGFSRRHFMALGGAGLALAGLGGRAFAQGAPKELAIQLNWLETADFAPAFAAELKGFDANHGIKQVFIPGGPQVDPVQSVAGGTAPVGFAGSIVQCALARAAGIPVKIFAAFYRASPTGIISLADTPINTPKDAIGKRIGLQGGARITWSIILAANGMTEDQMTIVPVAGDISPLVSKQVDGFWGTAVNQHIALELQGIPNHIMTRTEAGAPEHFEVIFGLESAIAERRDDIVAWLASLIEGQRYVMEHSDEVAEHIVARSPSLQLKPEQQKAQAKAGLDFINAPGKDLPLLRIDPEDAAWAIKQSADQGQLQGDVTIDNLMDATLLDDVYAKLG